MASRTPGRAKGRASPRWTQHLPRTGRASAPSPISAYDEAEAFERLTPAGEGRGAGDLEAAVHTTGTADAKAVFRQLITASPDRQARLIVRLSEANKLDVFCGELPWQWVEGLAESVHKAPSAEE